MTGPALLIKYGEIALRGGNRKIFEDMLVSVIKKRIEGHGEFTVRKDQGRFYAEWSGGGAPDAEALYALAGTVSEIFGLAAVCPCVRTDDNSIENLRALALMLMQRRRTQSATFKVEASRADKNYPMTSNEIAADIGAHLLRNIPGLSVDVRNPDTRLRVELRNHAFIYNESVKGPGGLPPGSGGKGVLLLSGGFDSPVAGYMAAKRGVELVCAYFHSPPYTSERAREKAVDLARRLARFTGRIRLYTVPFTETQLYLNDSVPDVKLTIFLKRAMLKAASVIAGAENAHALITGDSIGQVASQTMQALLAIDSAASYPVLRPLCGMDKLDIIRMAEKIGTHDISARPFADCCTLFVAKHPETKPKRSVIEGMETRLSRLDQLIADAVNNAEILNL